MATIIPTHWITNRRAVVTPNIAADVPDWFTWFIRNQYFQLTNETNLMQSLFQAFHVTAMTPGAVAVPVLLPYPYPDISYTIVYGSSWQTIISYSAQTATGFTFNFSVGVPGAGDIVCVNTVH